MGTLTKADSNATELVTEILEEALWWGALRLIVEFLRAKQVETVTIKFGYVMDRHIAGKEQGQDQILPLAELESFVRTGISDGTIEREGSSDFLFYPLGSDLAFMLCNDSDLHFASATPSLLLELGQSLRASGIKVYESGRLI